jgi:hypothetical protein
MDLSEVNQSIEIIMTNCDSEAKFNIVCLNRLTNLASYTVFSEREYKALQFPLF